MPCAEVMPIFGPLPVKGTLKPAKKPLMLSLSLGSYCSGQRTHHLAIPRWSGYPHQRIRMNRVILDKCFWRDPQCRRLVVFSRCLPRGAHNVASFLELGELYRRCLSSGRSHQPDTNRARHLAPIEMAWEGKSMGGICQQIK